MEVNVVSRVCIVYREEEECLYVNDGKPRWKETARKNKMWVRG
jgi:hypothetical protein